MQEPKSLWLIKPGLCCWNVFLLAGNTPGYISYLAAAFMTQCRLSGRSQTPTPRTRRCVKPQRVPFPPSAYPPSRAFQPMSPMSAKKKKKKRFSRDVLVLAWQRDPSRDPRPWVKPGARKSGTRTSQALPLAPTCTGCDRCDGCGSHWMRLFVLVACLKAGGPCSLALEGSKRAVCRTAGPEGRLIVPQPFVGWGQLQENFVRGHCHGRNSLRASP